MEFQQPAQEPSHAGRPTTSIKVARKPYNEDDQDHEHSEPPTTPRPSSFSSSSSFQRSRSIIKWLLNLLLLRAPSYWILLAFLSGMGMFGSLMLPWLLYKVLNVGTQSCISSSTVATPNELSLLPVNHLSSSSQKDHGTDGKNTDVAEAPRDSAICTEMTNQHKDQDGDEPYPEGFPNVMPSLPISAQYRQEYDSLHSMHAEHNADYFNFLLDDSMADSVQIPSKSLTWLYETLNPIKVPAHCANPKNACDMRKRGILYSASGLARAKGAQGGISRTPEHVMLVYIQALKRSVRSLRNLSGITVPIALIMDEELTINKNERKELFDLFDMVFTTPWTKLLHKARMSRLGNETSSSSSSTQPPPPPPPPVNDGWNAKLFAFLSTPFESTMHLDADTLFCADPSEMLRTPLRSHHIAVVREIRGLKLTTSSMLQTIANYNTAVLVYRKQDIVSSFFKAIMRQIALHGGSDQKYFTPMSAGPGTYFENHLRIFPLPHEWVYQMCRVDHKPCFVSGPIRVIHGRCMTTLSKYIPLCETLNKPDYVDQLRYILQFNCQGIQVLPVQKMLSDHLQADSERKRASGTSLVNPRVNVSKLWLDAPEDDEGEGE